MPPSTLLPSTRLSCLRLRPRPRPRPLHFHFHIHPRQSPPPLPRRAFFNLPSSLLGQTQQPQTLTAQRTLPYPAPRLFDLIADIDSYARFLPYCKSSRVTAWTPAATSTSASPGSPQRQWPSRADLTAGWGALEETYTSRVFCIPPDADADSDPGIVEAISGDAWAEIPAPLLARHGLRDPGPQHDTSSSSSSAVFRSLVTRWTVSPTTAAAAAAAAGATETGRGSGGGRALEVDSSNWSDVRLSIKFRFANPLYGAVSSAVADKVAPVMVEAFVERARRVLGAQGRVIP